MLYNLSALPLHIIWYMTRNAERWCGVRYVSFLADHFSHFLLVSILLQPSLLYSILFFSNWFDLPNIYCYPHHRYQSCNVLSYPILSYPVLFCPIPNIIFYRLIGLQGECDKASGRSQVTRERQARHKGRRRRWPGSWSVSWRRPRGNSRRCSSDSCSAGC